MKPKYKSDTKGYGGCLVWIIAILGVVAMLGCNPVKKLPNLYLDRSSVLYIDTSNSNTLYYYKSGKWVAIKDSI